MLFRSIGSHSAEELADSLQMPADGERQSFLEVARSFPRQYSKDGRFSTRQLRETEAFFRASAPDLPGVRNYSVDSMIVDRWAGRKP